MRLTHLAFVLFSLSPSALVACGRSDSQSAAPASSKTDSTARVATAPAPSVSPGASPGASAGASTAISSSASAAVSPAAPIVLGERITSPLVPLADIARNPARYRDQVVATSGKVTSVCREMGCWMELEDASGRAHVRMHGHTFFVPKTSPGHIARVQATVVKPAGGADDCEEKPGASSVAKIELDATGVEIN